MSVAHSSEAVAKEQWRPIPGYRFYEVSNIGRVRSWHIPGPGVFKRKHPKILKLNIGTNGYYRVHLVKLSEKKHHSAHRLVAAAFLGPSHGMEVNHKDGDKLNNCIENLEYISGQANMRHAWDAGLIPSIAGEKNPSAKLSRDDVDIIRLLLLDGFKGKDIAASYGVQANTISDIKNGRTWRSL